MHQILAKINKHAHSHALYTILMIYIHISTTHSMKYVGDIDKIGTT